MNSKCQNSSGGAYSSFENSTLIRHPSFVIYRSTAVDQTLLHLINQQWTNSALDLFMAALSNSAIWMPFLIAGGIVAVGFGGFRARACLICMVCTLLVTEQITGLLKNAVDRHRPKQVETVRMVELQRARPKFLTLFKKPRIRFSDASDQNRSGPSFPSGHVTNNTVAAVCLTLFYRRRGSFYWIVAALIGYSRVYLGAHWPSDVIATFFLATGEALIMIGLLELIWRSVAKKFIPQIYIRHPTLMVGHVSSSPCPPSPARGATSRSDRPTGDRRHSS